MYKYTRENNRIIKYDLLTNSRSHVVANVNEMNKLVYELVVKQREVDDLRMENYRLKMRVELLENRGAKVWLS